jgi:hypothetical protein
LYLPATIATHLSNQARELCAFQALDTAHRMLLASDRDGAIAQIREGLRCSDSPQVMRSLGSLLTAPQSEPLLRSLASLLLSTEPNQLLTSTSNGDEPYSDLEFELRDINLIVFPDWKQPEEFLYQDLANVIRSFITHPDQNRMTLLIENSDIPNEDARFIISGVIINLLQQEHLDITENEPEISLIGELSGIQWELVLQKIHARIVLENENKQAITKVEAENIPNFTLEELEIQIRAKPTWSLHTILTQIQSLPGDWHTGGALSGDVLQAILKHVKLRDILYSVETGSGASTLLLSHISKEHKVFSYDCGSNGLSVVRASPLLNNASVEFIEGPTQQTLPQYKFEKKLQLALIDGPHAYPFPDIEYYFIYPHLEENALIILDDIHIPNIYNLFRFLEKDNMFNLIQILGNTAFFRRTNAPLFSPIEDGWSIQNYNKNRFPIRNK